MGHLIGSWSKQKDAIRDGPSGGGEGGGSGLGVENFRAVGNFFGYQIPCMNFF